MHDLKGKDGRDATKREYLIPRSPLIGGIPSSKGFI